MIRSILLVALAVACASAQRWPMITVNANGEIVLQSLTRAQSFQVTPAAVTTAPSSSGTASLSTATALTAGVSAFVVTTVSSPATGHGVTLPTPSVGAQVTLLQGQTTFTSYTIWTSSTSVFVNNDAVSNSIVVYARRTVCQAISTTRWNCVQDAVDTANQFGLVNVISSVTATTTTATLSIAQSGGAIFFSSANAATATYTPTLPSCTTANVGANFRFIVLNGAAQIHSLVLTPQSSDRVFVSLVGKTTTVSTAISTNANSGSAAGSTGTAGSAITISSTAVAGQAYDVTLTCVAANQWYGLGIMIIA